MIKKAQLPDVW